MFLSQLNQALHRHIKLRFVSDVCFNSRYVSFYAYGYSRRLCSNVEILMNRSSSASSRDSIFNSSARRPLPGIQHKISSRDIDMPVSDFHVIPHGKGTPFNLKSTIGSHNGRCITSLMSAAFSGYHLRTSFDKFNYAPVRYFSTRNISGRLFYRRRPKMVPRYKPKNRRSCWLEGCPQKKGVCVTIRVVTPRKPNSGLRKVARVRLSTGRTVTCHVPGEGHNLHTHSVVLVRGGRCQDVSGCHYKVVRSKYDLLPVKNRASSRSKYGVRLSDAVIEKRRLRKNQLHVTTELDRELFNSLYLNDWINHDGSRRLEPLGPDEPLPVDIFSFNSRLRNIIHNSKS